ncbi:MAG: InlB B-repeat-containing protein [Paludibacteraceae bacterium]|nr:InlB B-repeat-containing protein [Paludibacteraceae bacterium]
MKNSNLLNRLLSYSHEKQSPQRFGRYAVMLLMLLTLGVGQMWAEGWICRSTGASGNQATKNIGDKLNSSGWDYTFTTNGGWDNGWVKVYVGTSTSSYTSVSASWVSNDGSNKNVKANIGNVTFDKSGKWYAVGVYKNNSSTVYTTTNSTWTSNTTFSMGSNSEPYWTVNPPSVSSFSVARSGYLAGSGTSEDPYLVASGSTLTLTGSGSKAISDANSSVNYKFGSDAYSTTATKNITVTSSGSIAVKARCINSSASLNGTETSAITIYYAPVSVKDISVYIYVGGCTSDQINSIELFGTPYVGSVALDAVHYYIGDFTIDGNWRKYTFTNVSEVRSLVVARSGGRAVDNITATADVYAKWDGTALDGKCVSAPSLTWTTAPANGTAGEDMTALVNTSAVSGGSPSIIWTSSDDGVATVSNGVITYVAAGTATITAAVSWSATGDYCAGSQNLAQAITVSAAIVPTISAASFTNNPILTWEWVKISFTYANIPDGAYYRIKGGAGYYRDKNNLTNIPISGDGTEDFEAACDQVNMIDNQSWVVEIYNSSNVKIVERTVGNLRVTSQAAELSSITLSPNTTQNYAGSPIDITMSVTSKYVPNPVVIFYVADNSNSTTYEVVATTGAIGSRTNYTTTHTATFSASHAATYSVTAKVFAGKLVDDFESTITTWENVGGGTFSTVANPYQQAKNGSSHVKQITPNGEDWKTALTRTTSAWNNDYQYIHAKMYYQGGTDLRWKINDVPTELVQTIGATSTWQDVAFNNSGRATINFMFPFVKGQTNVFYVDDIILSTEASMTARATQSTAASVTVRDVYTITYKDQGNVAFSGSHVDSPSAHPTMHTYGAATTLNSATKTGYTFNGWFTTSACTGDAVTTLGATAYSDDITLYAKWTENTVTVSPTNHYDAGNPSYSNPTASNSGTVGIVSTSQLVAPTPGTGYTFTGWTLSNNLVVTVGNAATDRTITVRTNGDGNAVSATANYNEVLTTVWYLTGSFNSWSASANKFAKRTGESTGSVAYTTIDLPASTHYEFGVNNGSSYYSNNNGSSETYYIKESVENWTFEKDLGYGVNCHMKTTVAGTYTFKIDFSASNPKISVTYPVSYTLTYAIGSVNGTSGSITTSPSTASGSKVISGTNITLTAPEAKTGYTWKGWYTDAAGTTGKIDDTNRAITVTMNANKTLYACYTENEYPVTVSTGANGDVSPKGTVNVKQISGTSLTATPNTGYHFVDWTISDGGITPGSSTSATQIFKATETGGTIHANFAETMHTVNVASNNTAFGTVSPSSVSAGIATASETITATPATGATFTGWTGHIGSGVTIVAPATTSSTSITINATADSKSITANFSETKHTVTLTNENSTYGTVNTSSPVSVGQITAVRIQATAKTNYMFSGWVKTGGSGTVTYHTAEGTGQSIDATGDKQSLTYITVDGDVTLQATWEEDRTTGWYLCGPWDDGRGWGSEGWKPFIKNVGEASGTISHVQWSLDPRNFDNGILEMKMYNGSNYWGHWSVFDADDNLCTKDANNTNIGFYSGDENKNFRISISVYGVYDFEWDESSHQLTVHYPEGNFIRGDFNSWGWEDVLTETGTPNEYAKTISLAANQTWTAGGTGFKAVILGDHYGKNSTTITRASNTASPLRRDGANIGLTTDVAGDYTFTINTSTKNLSVTYPTAYTVTYGYGTGGSAVTASATSRAGSFASGGYVASGDDITFTQTPAAGYTFKGWYTTADGNATVPTMGESDNVLNGLSGNATVYAQYIPTTYTNVTLNATTGSTNGAYSVTFGGTSITITTAPLKTGYEPEGYYESYADGVWANKIANPDGSLINNTTYTDATGHWTATNRPILYTKWQPKKYGLTLDKNGSSAGYLTNGSVTATYDSKTLTSLIAPTRTGYHIVDGYYKEPGLTNKIITVGGTLCASTDYTDASGNWTNDGAVSLYAKWAPNIYTITFDPASGTVDPTSASVTFDAAISDAPVPTRTGYTFTGYNTAGGASITTNGGVFKSSVDGFTDGSAHWIQPDDATITAQWTPNPYTITLTQSTETGYGSAGTASVEATYDAALPTIASLPTAANGYAFMGYYTAKNGGGTQYYDATGTKIVATYTTAADLELFAYFKKAEITLAFDDEVVLPEGTVGVTPTISPTPVGTTKICWTILHGDDTPLDPQPALTWSEGKLTFAASSYSGTYKVQAVLRTGSSCDGGDELDTETSRFMVAGTHNVTVNYKCGDDVIKASTIMENVEPLNWTDEFTAPDVFGYTFARWDAADGVTIKNGDSDPVTTSTNATIQIKATYNGNLTAVYTQKSMIYFKNTLGWSNVYVNFYSSSYWNNPKGSGNKGVTNKNLAMTRYGETDIWYYDYGAASITPSLYVSFTSESQSNMEFFWKSGGVNVVYPANYPDAINTDKSSETGFKAATPMFVPLATQDKVTLNQSSGGKADYYNAGYWTMYTPGTGYRLEIYNSDGSSMIKYADFESADDLMPMKAVLDLEGGQTYKFQLRRGGESSAGVYYGNSGTMTYTNHGQDTPWAMTNEMDPFKMVGITTNAAGDYTFNLSYSPNSTNQYRLRIAVDYPVKSGDYRLVYKDDEHTNIHPSAIVSKVNNGTDIVSFFVRHDQNPEVRIQQATVNDKTGVITWKEYPTDGTPTNQITGDIASAITAGGTEVYNFNLSMNESGAMTVASAEIYEGNFYIRTDAANSKWDNYRTDPDHRMTYSEYSITHGGYTHYYTHWVDKDVAGRKNVKFVIANDYSPCISDTLTRETATGTWANIDKFIEEGGDLKRSANVRYMWDKRTNTISRAYIDGAQGDYSSNFLYMLNVEEGADKIKKEDDTALTDHKVTFKDNGNWMYEANIKAQPESQIRLLSNWGTENTITQYFRGAADDTETLLGGSGDTWYDIRIIYDFKTNRLIAGLIPSGTIDEQMAIHADVMFVRDHQGDIAQLTFAEKDDKMGAITDIETAFGVIQFNKWTINNKSREGGHSPLTGEDALSRYERDLFYVSFPFRVNLEEVFGFGTYGTHWIIEEYDGAARAANGFWADTETFWRFITNRKGKFLEPNVGYLLALDLDELGESSDVWSNTDQVELYFPSYGTMPNITKSTVIHEVPEHTCSIGPRFAGGDDRRIKDSHWNLMSVPTYVNTKDVTFANTDWITTADEEHVGPNFLYTVNWIDNSLSARSGVGYTYKAMHAYIVQYCGNVTWTTSVSPATAPRRNPEAPKDAEYRLELRQNEQTIDQTFVRMSDDEHVTTGFDFNYDLSKEFNKNKANIYTMVTTMMEDGPSVTQTAGNTLPLTEQTTVVPVGVKIVANGDYTFAIPEGTNGVGVTLIDNETGIRTSLSALDYTINLPAGTYDNRFVLEISPVHQSPTAIELLNGENGENGVRKVLIDNILYIVKDGVMYDARGNRVQ